MIKSFPETVILELVETLKVSMTEPDVLPLRSVIVPMPITGAEPVNDNVILVPTPIAVAAFAGLMELNAKSTVVKL